MERIHSINPQRIRWCCQDFQVNGEQVASKINISSRTWEKALSGKGGLTFLQLSKLADYFGRGVLFFLEPGPVDEEMVHTPQFRKLANAHFSLTPEIRRLIEAVENQREAYKAAIEEMEDTAHSFFMHPNLDGLGTAEAAAFVRTWLGLTEKGDFNWFRTRVQSKGILVFRLHGFRGRWHIPRDSSMLGFTLYDSRCPVLVVRSSFPETLQTFTLMHELGHLLLHRKSTINLKEDVESADTTDEREREANRFAGLVLVPGDFLGEIKDEFRPIPVSRFDEWLAPQRKAWGVSTEVILRRLMDEQRLSRELYREYRVWVQKLPGHEQNTRGSRQYRHREPLNLFGHPFVRTILDAKNAGVLTLARTSTFLDGLKLEDLHQLERYCANH